MVVTLFMFAVASISNAAVNNINLVFFISLMFISCSKLRKIGGKPYSKNSRQILKFVFVLVC